MKVYQSCVHVRSLYECYWHNVTKYDLPDGRISVIKQVAPKVFLVRRIARHLAGLKQDLTDERYRRLNAHLTKQNRLGL